MSERNLNLYEKSKRFIKGVIERIRLRTKNLGNYVAKESSNFITATLVVAMAFLLSGAILALTYPLPAGVLFVERNFNYQAILETILYVILIIIAFLGIYLMDKAVRKVRLDTVLFSIGTLLFVCVFLALIYIVTYMKGYPLWPPKLG